MGIETHVPDPDRANAKMISTLILDPNAGYAPVKVEIQDQIGSAKPYRRFSYEMTGHVEVIPGLWFPATAKFRVWGIVDGASKRDLERTAEVVFEGWHVNPPSEPKAFTLSFPKGLQVYDSVHNTSYFAKEVDDTLVQQQVDEANRLFELHAASPAPPPAESPSHSIFLWIGGATFLIVSIAAAIVLMRSQRTPKQSPRQ